MKQAYECRAAELEKVKAESHKRKKIIATQQLVMQNGKEAYNKVILWNMILLFIMLQWYNFIILGFFGKLNTDIESWHKGVQYLKGKMADQENIRPVDDFYPCDAVLMQTLAMARSLSVCHKSEFC